MVMKFFKNRPVATGKTLLGLLGLAGSLAAASAQTIQNASFEEDSFSVFPGYVNGNGPISGWDSPGGAGVNPGTNFSPFADNGTIPDGAKVAFIQEDGKLAQVVSGFETGSQYCVRYFENARGGNSPSLEVTVGGVSVIAPHKVTSVGGTAPYREVVSSTFQAGDNALELAFVKSNPRGGDNTVLVDNISILPVPPNTKPTIYNPPVGGTVLAGGSITLAVALHGSIPMTIQWMRDGQPVPLGTDSSLILSDLTAAKAGQYTVKVTNSGGSVTSDPVTVSVLDAVGGTFNTGVGNDGVVLNDSESDPHFTLILNADKTGSSALVQRSDLFPIQSGPWLANTDTSKWIGPRDNTAPSAAGDYTYRTFIDLTSFDPATVSVTGTWATDNGGGDILVNGVGSGNTSPDFLGYYPFTLGAGFVSGLNAIDFKVNNAGAGWTGLRVDGLRVGAKALPAGIPITIVTPPASVSGRVTGSATFTVAASGSAPVSYEWSYNGKPIPGETGPRLVLRNLSAGNAGSYAVKVTNPSGSVTPPAATLTVNGQTDVSAARYAGIWIKGIVGRTYRIEYTEDLGPTQTWTSLADVKLTASPFFYLDRTSAGPAKRFYRAELQTP